MISRSPRRKSIKKPAPEELKRLRSRLKLRSHELSEARRYQAATGAILRAIAASPTDIQPVLDTVAKSAARLCEAYDVVILLADGEMLIPRAHRGPIPLNFKRWPIGRDWVTGRAYVDRKPIHVHDILEMRDEYPTGHALASRGGGRTVLAVPLLLEARAIGVLAMRRREKRRFSQRQIDLVKIFADQAAITIENARLFDEVQELAQNLASLNQSLERKVAAQVSEIERVNRLRRFLPEQVANLVVASSDAEDPLKSHRREVTVVFCDLRGFTAFAEIAEPEEVMAVLGEYHACLGALIDRHEGTLERFIGDGLLVVFNDPLPCPDHTERAVRMAVAMRDAVGELAEKWQRAGHSLGFGIGIARGHATIGKIGFDRRSDYAVIGSVPNLAARLCDEAKAGQILASQRAFGPVEPQVEARALGEIALKGFHRPMAAFDIIRWRE